MDFTIIPVTVSIVFFVLAMFEFKRQKGSGSMFQIGLFITAAAFMYLGINFILIPATPFVYSTSNIIITQGSTNTIISSYNQTLNTGTKPAAEDVYIYEASAYLYLAICLIFCLAGVLTRLGNGG